MSYPVPAEKIEQLVGARRHPHRHIARADTTDKSVTILHSDHCRTKYPDLRDCPYSHALDAGIDLTRWQGWLDRPVVVVAPHGELIPAPQLRIGRKP